MQSPATHLLIYVTFYPFSREIPLTTIKVAYQQFVIIYFILFDWHAQNATIPRRSQELLPYTFFCHSSPPTILPCSSLHLAIYSVVYHLVLLFPNSYTILFWDLYFIPFSVHVQTNVISVALLSLLW
jgi:hypothetical protein